VFKTGNLVTGSPPKSQPNRWQMCPTYLVLLLSDENRPWLKPFPLMVRKSWFGFLTLVRKFEKLAGWVASSRPFLFMHFRLARWRQRAANVHKWYSGQSCCCLGRRYRFQD